MAMVDISGLDHAEILAALYNESRPKGLEFLYERGKMMTKEEAQTLLDGGQTYFDYLYGRVMKIELTPNTIELETALYNRDVEEGKAESIIAQLRQSK